MMPHATPTRTPDERAAFRRRCLRGAAAAGLIALVGTALIGGPAQAAHPEVSLSGSNFEIEDPDETGGANLKVDDAAPPSLDWANVTEARKSDALSGSGDDSFGQGSKEDTEPPTVVAGSIPPNKSDLKTFGTYLEETDNGDFLHMFWHRVQDPTGTTNMDFEFNQSEIISSNGVTPQRTAGDLLIQYDLANGGTNPELFLSRWITADEPRSGICEASNALPCWEDRVSLSAAGDATGSINTAAIPSAESDGLGNVSARTFGEASVDFSAIVGDGCVTFGSAYLKSRSSDSFPAALKDFIAPLDTGLDTCAKVTIRKVTDPSPNPNDESFSFTTANFATPDGDDPTFSLGDGDSEEFDQVFLGTGLTVTEDLSELPAGWKLGDIDCDASEGVTPVTNVETGTITFDLDANSDSVDCTYYNETGGTVIIRKATDPTTDPADWQFGFTKAFDTLEPSENTFTLGHGESETFENVLIGDDYTITEDDLPDGWAFEDIDCGLSDGVTPSIVDATITFSIDDADDLLDCTYGNETGGTVIIHKVTQPASDTTTSFAYSTTVSRLSGEASSPFSLKNLENQTYTDVLFDTGLTVTEDSPLPDGWELVSVNCDASVGVTPTSIVGGTVTFDIDDVEDVLECTYTNRASGSITIEKITDSGTGSFDFTSNTLTPDAFTLTTTAAGDAGKDSEAYSDLDPGTYDVAETVPDYWNLVSATCDDESDPASIELAAGENITCTFHNDREVGAIEITKLRKHALDGLGENHPHENVEFVITGGELPAEGVTVTTDENGVACATGLLVSGLAGLYTITETVPVGYAPVGTQTANVTEAADCASANAGAVKEFVNTPLTNITVSVDSQVDGGTFSSIECDVDGSDTVSLAEEMDDPSITINDLEPRTVVCTIVIDP
jgi:hypothetical protein